MASLKGLEPGLEQGPNGPVLLLGKQERQCLGSDSRPVLRWKATLNNSHVLKQGEKKKEKNLKGYSTATVLNYSVGG